MTRSHVWLAFWLTIIQSSINNGKVYLRLDSSQYRHTKSHGRLQREIIIGFDATAILMVFFFLGQFSIYNTLPINGMCAGLYRS